MCPVLWLHQVWTIFISITIKTLLNCEIITVGSTWCNAEKPSNFSKNVPWLTCMYSNQYYRIHWMMLEYVKPTMQWWFEFLLFFYPPLSTPKKNEFFSQISQQQKKSTEACTTAFSIARPLGAKYGLKWVNILLYITIYMLYDLKLPLNYWSFSYDLNDPKKKLWIRFFKVLIFVQTLLYTISTNINFSISKNIFYQIDLWPLSIHQKLLTSRLWS